MSGNGGDAQKLADLERVIMQTSDSSSTTLSERMRAVSNMCESVAQSARDHAMFVEEISTAFAQHIDNLSKEFKAKMLESERKFLVELEERIGE